MANYLKGIGDAATRTNEIMPNFDARINGLLLGHTTGIIKGEYNEFAGNAIDRGVVVKSGMMQAYGFFGCVDIETQINFVMPSSTQYVHLYAEIDLSLVPNRFEVKATTMSNTSAWTPRQDNLKTVPNGKYQFPLWQVTLTASSIILTDRRAYIAKPLNAVNAEYATNAADAERAVVAQTAATQAQSDNSTKIATTAFVKQAITAQPLYCHYIYVSSANMYTDQGGSESRAVMVWFMIINNRAEAYTASDIASCFPNQNLGAQGTIPMRSVTATGRVQNETRQVIAAMKNTTGTLSQMQLVLHEPSLDVNYYITKSFPVQTVVDTVVKLSV